MLSLQKFLTLPRDEQARRLLQMQNKILDQDKELTALRRTLMVERDKIAKLEYSLKVIKRPTLVEKPSGVMGTTYTKWIIDATCVYFGVQEVELVGASRFGVLARARKIAMYLARTMFPFLSYPELGRAFGDRDHTTVMAAVSSIARQIDPATGYRPKRGYDKELARDVESVRKIAIDMMPEDRRPLEELDVAP